MRKGDFLFFAFLRLKVPKCELKILFLSYLNSWDPVWSLKLRPGEHFGRWPFKSWQGCCRLGTQDRLAKSQKSLKKSISMYKYGFFHSKEFVEVHKMVYSTDIHYTYNIHTYVRVLCTCTLFWRSENSTFFTSTFFFFRTVNSPYPVYLMLSCRVPLTKGS